MRQQMGYIAQWPAFGITQPRLPYPLRPFKKPHEK
jgi:hypothetical protein